MQWTAPRSCAVKFLSVALTFSLLSLASAGEPVPPEVPQKVWRQYSEIPELLHYEGFEGRTSFWSQGKLETTVIQAPNNHSWKMGEAEWGRGDKWLWAAFNLTQSPFKFPGGLDPNNIYIQFMLYSDELGEIQVKCQDGDFANVERVQKLKTWAQYNCKLSDCIKDKNRPKSDMSFREFSICMKPRDKNKPYPNVYVDDIIITYGVRPETVLPRAIQAEMKRSNLVRIAAKDGFTYTIEGQDSLKSLLKSNPRKHKMHSVLVVGPRASDSADLAKALSSSAAKNKLNGFSFTSAADVDGSPVGGLTSSRMLLTHNIQKADAEYVVVLLGFGDSLTPGRPADSVRILIDRILDMGSIPVVCMAASMPGLAEGDKKSLESFINTSSNVCGQYLVPLVDSGSALKNVQAPFDGKDKELNTAGLSALADLASQALKHVDSNLFGRH